jgi:OOP family OmpA-OmpF porin
MEKRILAVLIAALAGGAYAQSNVTSGASGSAVTNPYGLNWQSSASGTAAARTQVAQANTAAPAERRTAPEAAGTTARSGNPPPSNGYVGSGAGVVATNPFGLCWRSGGEWSADKAAAPCDAVPRASVPPAPIAKAPEPAPVAAVAVVTPPPVVIEKITLSTDVLFAFNKADLLPGGQQRLDELAKSAQGANVDQVVLVGHADRIGSEEYNQDLSEKRAQAVADYLAQKGVDSSRLQVEGRGKSEPITGNECAKMGAESNKNQKLIACLQPDRRVDAELLGSRESTASTGSPSAAGATSGSSSSSGSASGASSSESGTTNK